MSRPVFYADDLVGAAPGATVFLEGAEGHHAAQVVRLRAGEQVDVVDGRGRRARGVVLDIARDKVSVTIREVIDEPMSSPRIVVVQALAKGDRGERAVETLTEVGVDVIVPWSAAHSVSQWRGDKADRGVDKWYATARTAAKQSRRARVPEVRSLADLDAVHDIVQGASVALLLDETAEAPISRLAIPSQGDVVIIVGPEGGISEAERATISGWGAQAVHLGPTVMRTSTAGTAAAAIVLAGTARWQ